MSALASKPVWKSVVLTSSLVVGFFYGLGTQRNYYANAKSVSQSQNKIIEEVRAEMEQEKKRHEAEARGEDVSLFDVPPGLRSLAASFRNTNKANATEKQ